MTIKNTTDTVVFVLGGTAEAWTEQSGQIVLSVDAVSEQSIWDAHDLIDEPDDYGAIEEVYG